MKNKINRCLPGVCAFLLLASLSAHAGGPLDLCAPNVPFLWPNGGVDIPFNPDQGGLGPLTNAEAAAAVEAAFQAWDDVPTATVTYMNAGPLAVDVDATNFFGYYFTGVADGLSPIVFDEDGTIFELLFGPDSGVLGFAGADVFDPATCAITEGAAFLNGPAFDSVEGLLNLMVHEFGHYTNLAHSIVNGQMYLGDSSGPSPDFTFGPPPSPFDEEFDVIETMYPYLFSGIDQVTRTPHPDDIAILSTLYPEAGFPADHGTLSGTITVHGTELSGINVIARNVDNPFLDAASAISGDFTQGFPETGTYTINGLTPGATYAVYVDQIEQGGFSTPPLLALPGPEEFHNAAGVESETDDPFVFDGVTVAAGAPSLGVDVIMNPFQPNTPLPVGEDGSVQIFLPFEFGMCGERFNSMFVNANGNVTFGRPDFQYFENTFEFLGGPPRVAGLWHDLSPFNLETGAPQGVVKYSANSSKVTVRWRRVPEFPDFGSNGFDITLNRLFDIIEITSHDLTAENGLVGISCGGAFTSGFERERNLSALLKRFPCGPGTACLPANRPAIFELFDHDNYDLQQSRLIGTTLSFFDGFEPNDSPAEATPVRLPFDTVSERHFSDIRPAGGDVDWFQTRRLKAGKTVVAEAVTGQIDSVMGLFDANGNLVAIDDDGGIGFLSRIEAEIPADGIYYIAVSTWPDFDFSGDGNTDPVYGVGRYVLDITAH